MNVLRTFPTRLFLPNIITFIPIIIYKKNERLQMARGKTKLAAVKQGVRGLTGLADSDSIPERTRGYQMEMFQESLKRNIIVAMDTGSGKTHIAILRIQAELDKGHGKLCWFLVPNVALGNQQYEVLKSSLPPIKIEFLSGIDKVDKWSDQDIWDGVLGLTKEDSVVIVSTHQVLLDALTHGFVKIEKIGLLIFDEAHHCVNYHPANRIMQDFYHPRLRAELEVPAILGLTASPVVKSKPDQLRTIEANLNAIARTPVVHRTELLKHVYPPTLKRVIYDSPGNYEDIEVVDFSELTDINVEKIRQTVTDPETGSESSSESPYANGEYNDGRARDGFSTASSELGSIDPRTGEPYLMEEYEVIDPITGESIRSGGCFARASACDTLPAVDDYEVIDPTTGESYASSQGLPTTNSHTPKPTSPKPNSFQEHSLAYQSLRLAYLEMDIMEDPYILSLRQSQNPDFRRIEKLTLAKNTYSQNQMKGLVSKATHVRKEYGPWATEWYIKEALRRSFKGAEETDGDGALMEWNGEEKKYLMGILRKVVRPKKIGPIEGRLTDKVEKLIKVLLEEYNDEEDGEGFAGLVFVEQRVEVTILQQILGEDRRTRDIFRSGTIVGSSQGSAGLGKGIYELVTPKNQIGVIDGFRSRRINLLISTSVVEEGLDIPACHLVVCFSLPPNLKSFIQRRGRARRAKSTYVLMFEEGDREGSVENFEKREKEMVAEYQDETRELPPNAKTKEEEDDDGEGILGEGKRRRFLIESTGACLTLDSAVSHLHHFCDCLPQGQYMNLNPIFTCEAVAPEDPSEEGRPVQREILYKAEVLMPNCIPPEARRTSGKDLWPSEKWAKRDAAFETYIALYHLKLVDDHLMPLLRTDADEEVMRDVEKRPSKVPVEDTMDPWAGVKWGETTIVYSTPIRLRMPSAEDEVEINMLTSIECPPVDPIEVYWTNKDIGEVTIGESRCLGVDREIVEWGKQTTYALLSSLFGTRMKEGVKNFPYLFVPTEKGDWNTSNDGVQANALDVYKESGPIYDLLVNDEIQNNLTFIVRQWRTDISPLDDAGLIDKYGKKVINPNQPVIEAVKITRRRDFLHPEANQAASEATVFLLPQFCTIGKIPWRFSQLALFLPGIIRRVEISLIASDLQRTLLAPVGIESTSLIVISLCASAAREPTDYQRFEFLGDSVMKFLTSVNLVDEHPLWHEGYLALKKDRLVSNARLAKAAQDKKLARWIITQIFTGVKWTPHYIQDVEDQPEKELGGKELSTKILADVVESLIGAAYLEGGYEKALKCINLFVPENNLKPLPTRIKSLSARAGNSSSIPSANLPDLETLIGYEFKHKALLLEAITHPSYTSDMNTVSYQRLEFLGDALLDMLVVPELFHHLKILSHIDMHLFKASVVNAHFLAFLSLGFSTTLEDVEAKPKEGRRNEFELGIKERKVELWKFMRHQNAEMTAAQKVCWQRYDGGFRETIQDSLDSSADYPWTSLYGLEADKFFSDIVEALLGAVFVDSGGDFGPVAGFAERLGILKTMRRAVRDGVDVTHPIKKLGELVAANGQATVEYIPSVAKGKHVCTVLVNGDFVAKVEDGSSLPEARVRAAEIAYDILRQQSPDMHRKQSKPPTPPLP